jgi:hypothetical protein
MQTAGGSVFDQNVFGSETPKYTIIEKPYLFYM